MITLPNLDCDVTSACQLACLNCNRMVTPYRHAPGGPPRTTPGQVERDLARFGRVARTKRWAALGGEPLLHPQLVDILRVARASGVAEELLVWTNGIALRTQRPAFWQAFDTLVLSVYPGKISDADLRWTQDACADAGVALVVKDERTTPNWTRILEPEETDDARTQAKYDTCWFRTYCFALNVGFLFRCCTSGHIPQLFQNRAFGSDGLPVEGLTEDALQAWLDRPTFMESCRKCAGRSTQGDPLIPWGEERNLLLWKIRSAGA